MPERFPEAKIRQALLHPDLEVRLTASRYFNHTHSQDPALMPLVIQAVQQYGRETAFFLLRHADRFVQSEATIQWLTEELRRDCDLEDVATDNYCTALALVLCHAPPELLAPQMVDLPCFLGELQEPFLERLDMAAWDWDALWDTLLDLAAEVCQVGAISLTHLRRKQRIVEALARHGGHDEQVLAVLHGSSGEIDRGVFGWLQTMVADLAGRLRLESAVPLLARWLDRAGMVLSNEAHFALCRIGSDAVVRELARLWLVRSTAFHRAAAEILGDIPTELAAETILTKMAAERDLEVKYELAFAALDSLIVDAVAPVRDLALRGDKDTPDERSDLRAHLVASAMLMETTFPEIEIWRQEAIESGFYGDFVGPSHPIRKHFDEEAELWDDEDSEDDGYEDWEQDEFAQDEGEEEDWDKDDEELVGLPPRDELDDEAGDEPHRPPPIRNVAPRPGRNDPCPCGSGKKYKKCCLKKDQNG